MKIYKFDIFINENNDFSDSVYSLVHRDKYGYKELIFHIESVSYKFDIIYTKEYGIHMFLEIIYEFPIENKRVDRRLFGPDDSFDIEKIMDKLWFTISVMNHLNLNKLIPNKDKNGIVITNKKDKFKNDTLKVLEHIKILYDTNKFNI